MTFVSYAQNLEDVMLWRALRDVDSGFYIDVGAWRPRDDSVTLAFYERNWRGVNIEPEAAGHAAMEAARPRDINLHLALGRESGEMPFFHIPDTGLSTVEPAIAARHRLAGREVERRTTLVSTLKDVCDRYAAAEIHFLKIDVEGAEAAVLEGADFTRYRPWIVVVEATLPNSTEVSHEQWEPMLLGAGYVFAWFDGVNRFYLAKEREDALGPAFTHPPNALDDYASVAAIRKAAELRAGGARLAELEEIGEAARGLAEQSEERAAAAEARAAAAEALVRDAEAKARDAETQAMRATTEARFAAADAAIRAPADSRRPPALAVGPVDGRKRGGAPASEPGPRVFFDASLMLHHGFETPVGLVRVEQYVAEFLVRDPSLELGFVRFEAGLRSYRALSNAEMKMAHDILFRRYGPLDADAESDAAPNPAPDPPPMQAGGMLPEAAEPPADPAGLRLLRRRLRTAATLPPAEFDAILRRDALRALPVTAQQSRPARLATRIVRRIGLHAALGGHGALFRAAAAVRGASQKWRHIARPDPQDAPAAPAPLPEQFVEPGHPSSAALPETQPGAMAFRPGDVVLCMSNTWDYMDYEYLHRICRQGGVRFVSVIYDVIAMQHRFTTPGPPHIYHRHWVEMGHSAAHLLAISQHSMAMYRRYISEPNDLSPPMDYAYLPNFLRERAAEIGEQTVPELEGRQFVVFCSTIEIRKNHQLLVHVWDRLREEIGTERLPTLVFVGKWGWGTEAIRLLIERNARLRPRLRVLDRIGDAELIWLYRNARFTVFPAVSEGFGLAAAESLSFGTPAVVSNCPALIEASEGLMPALDPLDTPAWVAEMRDLILDDARLAELREAAARYRGVPFDTFGGALRDIALGLAGGGPAAERDAPAAGREEAVWQAA